MSLISWHLKNSGCPSGRQSGDFGCLTKILPAPGCRAGGSARPGFVWHLYRETISRRLSRKRKYRVQKTQVWKTRVIMANAGSRKNGGSHGKHGYKRVFFNEHNFLIII